MKHILDSKFQYRPSFATDVRKTFERVRREQRSEEKGPARGRPAAQGIRVVKLEDLKKSA